MEKAFAHFILLKGALSVNLWAGEILLHLGDWAEFADMEVSLVLPCEGYDKDWDDHNKKRMEVLRRRSRNVTVLGASGWPLSECYRKCSKYEIEQASGLLAVCDPYHLTSGDSKRIQLQTVKRPAGSSASLLSANLERRRRET